LLPLALKDGADPAGVCLARLKQPDAVVNPLILQAFACSFKGGRYRIALV
jgi:hypothetical protein